MNLHLIQMLKIVSWPILKLFQKSFKLIFWQLGLEDPRLFIIYGTKWAIRSSTPKIMDPRCYFSLEEKSCKTKHKLLFCENRNRLFKVLADEAFWKSLSPEERDKMAIIVKDCVPRFTKKQRPRITLMNQKYPPPVEDVTILSTKITVWIWYKTDTTNLFSFFCFFFSLLPTFQLECNKHFTLVGSCPKS